ncbi:hypothetical protein, partial [Sinorhizobium meliloti]|uniref:hypothetical protein n=1 Tax=Rhizobium meliloti TaxID=382 RepID=UPI001AECE8DD
AHPHPLKGWAVGTSGIPAGTVGDAQHGLALMFRKSGILGGGGSRYQWAVALPLIFGRFAVAAPCRFDLF